jgi:hypothetical protein
MAEYTWVDIYPVSIHSREQDLAGKWRCIVDLSNGGNIQLKYGARATDDIIMTRAQNYCDKVNADNTKAKMIALLRDIRQIANDKIDILQAVPE